jgi:hypothetical protein
MSGKKIALTIAGYCCIVLLSAQNVMIENGHLKLEVNDQLQTKINAGFGDAQPLVNTFSSSEYLVTKYFTAKNFSSIKKKKKAFMMLQALALNGNLAEQTISITLKKFSRLKLMIVFLMPHILMYNTLIMVKKNCPLLNGSTINMKCFLQKALQNSGVSRAVRMKTEGIGYKK